MWIERDLAPVIENSVRSRPAVLLTGARQTGKSSLLLRKYGDAEYISFDDLDQVVSAQESPEHFIKSRDRVSILDEIQYVPLLFRYLKTAIDADREHYGKWILTGSQQFEMMQNVSESLAGRISILHLQTLSARELRRSGLENFQDYLWKGGYPEVWSNDRLDLRDYFESYIRTYVERDLKSIIEVKNLNDFRRFFKIAASRVGQLLNYKDISQDVGVSDMTIRKWIHALEISGLIYLLPPFYANINKRLVKSPKLYFADHGLAAYLLGIESEREWQRHIHKGLLWENLVMMEYVKTLRLIPGRDIFFYRDQNGVEIDFLIERKNQLFLIEAKAAERIPGNRLNFRKVAPLLAGKYKVSSVLACQTHAKGFMNMGNYDMHNPLLGEIEGLSS